MTTAWTSKTFPGFEQPLRALTERHRDLKDEPLHLALCYGPDRDREDAFLLEVIGGYEGISPDGDLFEATFESVPGMSTGFARPLHMVLTTAQELKLALEESWPLAKEIVAAVRAAEYQVLFKDAIGDRSLRQIRAAARRPERARRG